MTKPGEEVEMSIRAETDIKKKLSEMCKKLSPDDLPIGVYVVTKDGDFVECNLKAREILGLPEKGKKFKTNINHFYCNTKERIRLLKELEEAEKDGKFLEKKIIRFKVKSQNIWVQIYCRSVKDPKTGIPIGYIGCLVDVTEEENYRQFWDTTPVGTFIVRNDKNGTEFIRQCNMAFTDMFEYSIEEIRGKEVKDLYASEKDYENFVKEIKERYNQNETIVGVPIRAKTAKGRILTLEVHCRLLKDKSGNILGRDGIVLDISNEVALRELRNDIGKVLHFYSATLVTLDQSIKPLLNALSPDPFAGGEVLTIDNAIEALNEPAKNLKNTLNKILELSLLEPGRRRALPEKKWIILKNQEQLLDEYETKILYPEFQLAALHEVSRIILNIHDKIEKENLPREIIRDVYNKAKELERICCLISTHRTLDTIIEVNYTIRALREFVIFQQRHPEPDRICKITSLIQNAVYDLYLFAIHRRVDIRQDYESCKALVKVEERSVLRALANLLYNAVKYSWFRGKGEKPWITVKAFTLGKMVHVEFQNFGVPITKEEIEDELIFNFGYRGQYSGDRLRLGSGVGLSDARDTARRYGGDVKITSRPAEGEDEKNYNQPFITTATFILPGYKEKESMEEQNER